MERRIVITGSGVVSALGLGKAANEKAFAQGLRAIAPVRYLKTSLLDFPVGEVPASDDELMRLCGVSERIPRGSLLSVLALREALSEAGFADGAGMPLISGTTVGGMDLSEASFPEFSSLHDCGASTDAAADVVGGFGYRTTLSTACSSAANALAFGARLIRSGLVKRVVAGGAESLSDYHLHGFASLMILDREPCRPFDLGRAGLNLGEAAAFLVLESEEAALERGVKPLALLEGWGNACDAYHQTASSENGEGAYLSMLKALESAGLKSSDIDYVNAHGTGTPNNDASESAALRRVFGEVLPPVSSTKALSGHTTSASGSLEAVFCMIALKEGLIPAQQGLSTPDPACILPVTESLHRPLRHILCNSFGFGGNDTSLIIGRYE
ncbi:MAG: beta-ketoacyl-[acyl-carrier-protein] synthase family protein [Bacteroidales bacterium]|nr:beta-ketoacyl-[acyl-carrier-protein] synthase family protein [Bacteroidales bacterium]